MKNKIAILGSTGSIGRSTFNVISRFKKNFKIEFLSTNSNFKKVYKQALEFNVKKIIINDKKIFYKYKNFLKKKKIKPYLKIEDILKDITKLDYVINGISGYYGLEPSLKIIPHTKTFITANKESIICGWEFIKKKLYKFNTKFIPIDSEHHSIWNVIKDIDKTKIEKIYLTASGGPFLNKKKSEIDFIKSSEAAKHPNWKMGKKISIDSTTMMNKIFEVNEAMKIFDLELKKFEIIIHPQSYIHAIIILNNGLIKFVAHDTSMEIPIFNSLFSGTNVNYYKKNFLKINHLNRLKYIKPSSYQFPLLNILKKLKKKKYFL